MEPLALVLSQLYHLLVFVLAVIASAGLTDLYVFSIGDPNRKEGPRRGRIASCVGLWLLDRYKDHETATREIGASRMRVAKTDDELALARRFDRVNPYKLLGMCPRCTGVWISLGMFVVLHIIAPISWWFVLLFVPLASIALGFSFIRR